MQRETSLEIIIQRYCVWYTSKFWNAVTVIFSANSGTELLSTFLGFIGSLVSSDAFYDS